MTWIDALKQYNKDKTFNTCPKCGAKALKAEEYKGSLNLSCTKCGQAVHFDGLRTKNNEKH